MWYLVGVIRINCRVKQLEYKSFLKLKYFWLFFNLATIEVDALVTMYYPLPKGQTAKLSLVTVGMIPYMLVFKLSWDNKRPASSNFSLQ